MRFFCPLAALLSVVLVAPMLRLWAADPPNEKSKSPQAAAQRDEAAGYSDPRDAVLLPERRARRDFSREVGELLKAGKFDALNKIYQELIESKPQFWAGEPKLAVFYESLTSRSLVQRSEYPLASFKLLRAWREKHPDVLGALVAEAVLQRDYAWYVKSAGPNIVSREDYTRLHDRLAKARQLVSEALDKQSQDPHLHVLAMDVARASDAPLAEIRVHLDKALEIDPDYFPALVEMASILLPNWNGAPGDHEAFLDEAVERTKDRWGQGAYPVLAMYTHWEGAQLFKKTRIKWPRMKAGFEDLRKHSPELMIYANQFCIYALHANDNETAARMFHEIGENFDREIWRARVLFDRQRKLTLEGDTRPKDQVVLKLSHFAYSMHFHPLTRYLYTSVTAREGIPGWDPIDGRHIENLPTPNRSAIRFDFSGDGDLLAYSTFQGELVVRNTQTGQDVAAVKLRKYIENLQLAADGSLVAALMPDKGEVFLFDVKAKSLRQIDIGDVSPTSMTLNPDASLLVTGEQGRQFRVWSTADQRELKRVGGFTFSVVALAFSPDGKTLAVGHATGPRPPKGAISFYDTATWEKTADITDCHVNYVGQLCYSPDGKLLASGSYDGRVKLWEVEGRKLRGELTDHLKRIACLAFSPDGRQLASSSDDLSTRISDLSQPPLNGEKPAK